jgi:RNAse (barnase) inhibitor barstar
MAQNFLQDTARAGLYHLPRSRRQQLREMAGQAHLHLLHVEPGTHTELAEILADLGKALHFPTWYGANLDALHDCLTDPDWQPKRGIVIRIGGLDELQQKAPSVFTTLLEVLASAARERSAAQHPLWILLDTPGPGVTPLPEA